MKRKINGDSCMADLVVANLAIDKHEFMYGKSLRNRYLVHSVSYANKAYSVEVVTRTKTIVATVLRGKRDLMKLNSKEHYKERVKDE